MEKLTKRYNERTGTYEYVDAFTGAGMFDSIIKKLSSNFVKNTAKTIGTKALEACGSRLGSEIGARAADKVISTVRSTPKSTSNPPKVESGDKIEDSKNKPLGNIIVKELTSTKAFDLLTTKGSKELLDKINAKKQYYGYGTSNKNFAVS